jgi:hypothetical protein
LQQDVAVFSLAAPNISSTCPPPALLQAPTMQELHWYKIPKDIPLGTAATMVIK